MAVKVRISYERPQELHTVLKLLNPVIKACKAEKGGSGRFKKAYVDLVDLNPDACRAGNGQ